MENKHTFLNIKTLKKIHFYTILIVLKKNQIFTKSYQNIKLFYVLIYDLVNEILINIIIHSKYT